MIAVRVEVDGRVQGVGFRWATMSESLGLGLAGWVRNLPGGSVEAHVQGDEEAVDALVAWLREGPIGARVRRCVVHPAEVAAELTSFEIRA